MPLMSSKRVLAIAAVSAVLIGCDDPHKADRRVRETIEESRLAMLQGGEEGMKKAQTLLDQAANEANAAAATKAHAKSMLAQAELDSATARMTDPVTGLDAVNRDIAREFWEIGELGRQIGESNTLVHGYRAAEPKEIKAAVQQRIAEASGGAGSPAWIADDVNPIPTLQTAQQQAAQLKQQVDAQEGQIKQLQAQQRQVAAQADQASRQADATPGRAGMPLFKQAADLRKQAADLTNEVELAQAKLAPVQQDLALAEARVKAINDAIAQFQQMATKVDAGWNAVQQQAAKQEAISTAILNAPAGDPKTQASIATKSAELAKQFEKIKETYDTAEQNLTDSVKHFADAESAAEELKRDIGPKASALPGDNQMKKALDTLAAIYNPAGFKLGQATAQLTLANLQSSRAQALNERLELVNRLKGVLNGTNLALPKELDDPNLPAAVKEAVGKADENYNGAAELFLNATDAAGADDSIKNGGRSGRIFALYGRSLLGRAVGDAKAAQYLTDARTARDTILQETPNALSALPAELVPPPSTQPAGTPATAPAEAAPPATTPAEGAAPAPAAPTPAPAEGATPAPAAPGEPAAPAAPAPAAPGEPAAPAAPAPAAPGEPAAPAAPAPAEGTAPAAPAPAEGAAPAPAPAPAPPAP